MTYEYLLDRFNKLESETKEIKSVLGDYFTNYYKEKYPKDIEKLENILNSKIIKLSCVEYNNEDCEWCKCVVVKLANNEIKTFIKEHSADWYVDGESICDSDDDIQAIIEDIYAIYPYTNIEFV
ncbi:MAG: hypothetical protein ACYDDE_00585 [bacterium]